jgi:hypothetical protein
VPEIRPRQRSETPVPRTKPTTAVRHVQSQSRHGYYEQKYNRKPASIAA